MNIDHSTHPSILFMPLFSSDSGSESNSDGTEDDHVTSTVADEGVPVPPEIETTAETSKSWLYRKSRTPSPSEEDIKIKKRYCTSIQVT